MVKKKTPAENRKLCAGCGSCCEYIAVLINPPKNFKQLDRIVWYLYHNVRVTITKDGEWKVIVPLKCIAQNSKKQCAVYSERPQICRDYSQERCEKYDKTYQNQAVFASVKEFKEYLRKKNIKYAVRGN